MTLRDFIWLAALTITGLDAWYWWIRARRAERRAEAYRRLASGIADGFVHVVNARMVQPPALDTPGVTRPVVRPN